MQGMATATPSLHPFPPNPSPPGARPPLPLLRATTHPQCAVGSPPPRVSLALPSLCVSRVYFCFFLCILIVRATALRAHSPTWDGNPFSSIVFTARVVQIQKLPTRVSLSHKGGRGLEPRPTQGESSSRSSAAPSGHGVSLPQGRLTSRCVGEQSALTGQGVGFGGLKQATLPELRLWCQTAPRLFSCAVPAERGGESTVGCPYRA